jgi:diacylglycerol kinase
MRLLNSFRYAWNGFKTAVKEEPNVRIHLISGLIAIVMGFYFRISRVEWVVVVTMVGLVIGFELLNSAIENLTDLATEKKLPLAAKIKDMSAAAVLIVSLIALIVGIIIFEKYIFS